MCGCVQVVADSVESTCCGCSRLSVQWDTLGELWKHRYQYSLRDCFISVALLCVCVCERVHVRAFLSIFYKFLDLY